MIKLLEWDHYKFPEITKYLHYFSRLVSVAVTTIGMIVILGWIFDISLLKSILPNLVTMKANTAIGFILGGISLNLWPNHQKRSQISWLGKITASLVLLLGLLTLIQYIFNVNLGIDQLFFQEPSHAVATAFPGRMAPNTALNFFGLGLATLSLYLRPPKYILIHTLAIISFLIAFLGLLGYIYGNSYFYQLGKSFTAMALHTAIAFILWSAGLLFATPNHGVMTAITQNNAGGIMAQRLYPAAIAIPPLLCWIVLIGFKANLYTGEMAICLLSISSVITFSVLISWNAKSLGKIDGERTKAEKTIKKFNEQLEETVAKRTAELRQVNQQLEKEIWERQEIENSLLKYQIQLQEQTAELKNALDHIKNTQSQLIQSEKMSSLGQLVAGIAHEINNPVSFISGNMVYLKNYTDDLRHIIESYQKNYPDPVTEIQDLLEDKEIDFVVKDFENIFSSMKVGVERISQIILSLRNFSRLDESDKKSVDIREGIESTLIILNHRLKPGIQVMKNYGNLPEVECYPSLLNQVFMNILANAIDALEDSQKSGKLSPKITIITEVIADINVKIHLIDNGLGMPDNIKEKIFDPYFTTKPIGKGTGLGLSISYQIIQKHSGNIEVQSEPGEGTEFIITLPLKAPSST